MKRALLVVLLAAVTSCTPVAVAPQPDTSGVPSTTVSAPTSEPVPSEPAPSESPTPTPVPPTSAVPAPVTQNVEITWYGSYDNDPKGSTAIDSPVIHKTAGGTGTWADPLTFASPVGADGSMAYTVGARIYVPSVQKYFIREDSCAISWTAPNGCGALTHVDLYIGNPSGTKDVLTCEDALTPDGDAPIVVNPAADLPVDATPLWTEASKTCHTKPVTAPPACAAPVICTTADSTAPLNITKPGVYDGQQHKVPSIAITASGVTVQGFVVQGGSQTGISSRGANNTIQDNDVSAIRYGTDDLDAIRFFGDHTRILRNRIHALVSGPIKDAHPDCVQTFATPDKGPSSDVEIGWNTCDPGNTQGHGQCVMAEGPGSTDGGGGATGSSARWNIHDNVCATSANQSISLRDIDDVTVTGNSFTGTNAKAVQLVDGSANVTFSGNVLGPNVGALSGD